jgi:hypothetical protein
MSLMYNYNDDDYGWWNRIPYELKCKGEIECYTNINDLHSKYTIFTIMLKNIRKG